MKEGLLSELDFMFDDEIKDCLAGINHTYFLEHSDDISKCRKAGHDIVLRGMNSPSETRKTYKDWKIVCAGCLTCQHTHWTFIGYHKPGER